MTGGIGEPRGEVVVYEEAGGPRVEVIVADDTVWLTLQQMAELFDRDRSVIGRHVRNASAEGELPREGSVQILQTTPGTAGRPTNFYNLDVVISVGYRVKSPRGTAFRKRATAVLRQHLIDGVTINQKRLEQRGREAERALAVALDTLRGHELISGDGEEVRPVP